MTSLGPLRPTGDRLATVAAQAGHRRCRSTRRLGLVDDYRLAAERLPALGLRDDGSLHGAIVTEASCRPFFAKIGGMTPSVPAPLQRAETLGRPCVRIVAGRPSAPRRWTASVTPRAYRYERGQRLGVASTASWIAACRAGTRTAVPSFLLARGRFCGTVSFHDAHRGERLVSDPTILGRMPESGKVTLKAQLVKLKSHISGSCAPTSGSSGYRRRTPPTIGPWCLETLSPETDMVIDFWHACEHLRTASDHVGGLRLVRASPPSRFCVTTPVASTR